MKIVITLKDPDGVSQSIQDAIEKEVVEIEGLSEQERQDLAGSRESEVEDQLKPWIKYGEYVSIEIDLKAKTAKVLPAD